MSVNTQENFEIISALIDGVNGEKIIVGISTPIDGSEGQVEIFDGLELPDNLSDPIGGPVFFTKEGERQDVEVTGLADFTEGNFIVALSSASSADGGNRIYATHSLQDNNVEDTGSTSIDVSRESFEVLAVDVQSSAMGSSHLNPKPVLQLNRIEDGVRHVIEEKEVDLSSSASDITVNFSNHGLVRGDRFTVVLLVDPPNGSRGFAARVKGDFTPS